MKKKYLLLVLGAVLVIIVSYQAWIPYLAKPIIGHLFEPRQETVATSTVTEPQGTGSTLEVTPGSGTSSDPSKSRWLTFTSPAQGNVIDVSDTTVQIRWQILDRSIFTTYPVENTHIYLQMFDDKGNLIGVVGPAPSPTIASTSVPLLLQPWFTLSSELKYKLRATLSYSPTEFTCNPNTPKSQECVPLYSPADQALVEKAQQYQSESGWFMFKPTSSR